MRVVHHVRTCRIMTPTLIERSCTTQSGRRIGNNVFYLTADLGLVDSGHQYCPRNAQENISNEHIDNDIMTISDYLYNE